MLILGMATAVTAAPKSYASAKDGELLYHLNFNDTAVFSPKGNDAAEKYYTYAVGDNGNSLTIRGTNKDVDGYWGAPIKGLEVDSKSQVTMTFKVKANGTAGKNNSVGIGGWLYDATGYEFLNNYSNWNSDDGTGKFVNRAALSQGGVKKIPGSKGDNYEYNIDKAAADKDGFLSVKIEFDATKKSYSVSYIGADGKWFVDDKNTTEMALLDSKADSLCFMVYSYYNVVDATIKDVKFYKGVGLTDAQLNPVVTTAATTKAPTTKPTSPATFDAAVVLAVVASMAGAGVVVSKKRH
jgi:hypothetical protein